MTDVHPVEQPKRKRLSITTPEGLAKAKARIAHKPYWNDLYLREHEKDAIFVPAGEPTTHTGQRFGFLIFPDTQMSWATPTGKGVNLVVSHCYYTEDKQLYHNPIVRRGAHGVMAFTRFIQVDASLVPALCRAMMEKVGCKETLEARGELVATVAIREEKRDEKDEVDELMKKLGGRV